jgi:hypothetical protein
VDKADAIPFDLKDERTIVFDLNDIDSIEECKGSIRKIVQVILGGKVPYHSPVFRALGVVASTAEEREAFIGKIAEQIDSIATDVSSIETTLGLSDIDQIDGIKDAVNSIEKMVDGLRDDVTQILSKLE